MKGKSVMAARGSLSKETIKNKILEVFPGSFLYNSGKEIRIPMNEEGELIQIKCTLTAAKTNVECGEDTAIPGAKVGSVGVDSGSAAPASEPFMNQPSEEEKEKVEELLKSLGLTTTMA